MDRWVDDARQTRGRGRRRGAGGYRGRGPGANRGPSQDIRMKKDGASTDPHPGSRKYPRDDELERTLFGAPEGEDDDSLVLVQTMGINFDKFDDIPVDVSGENCPDPVEQFEKGFLHDRLCENIKLCKYERPTPVQKYAVPMGLAGRDVMGCAQTGSGKTAAFLLPAIHSLLVNEPAMPPCGSRYRSYSLTFPRALVLAPTRELALQIYSEARKFCYRTGLVPVVVYGGQDIRSQMQALNRHGCDILVATPGRLVDLIERRFISLSCIQHLIFDEADRMLDMGFEPQIRRIVEQEDMPKHDVGPRSRQTMMFSATFPRDIQQLAQDFLHDYLFLAVGRVGSTTESIRQIVEYAADHDKRDRLMRILPTCDGLTLIFVETKRNAAYLEDWLYSQGINSTSIHGDRTQYERETALQEFRTGRSPVLVATSVASRGLDIPNVMHVINYDMPNNIDDYVHRIGRTGRCGNVGTAISFVNERSRSCGRDLCELLRENNQDVPSWLEQMALDGGGGRRRGGGGNSRFGARDFRARSSNKSSAPSSSRAGGNNPKAANKLSKKKNKNAAPAAGDGWGSFHRPGNYGGNCAPPKDAWDS